MAGVEVFPVLSLLLFLAVFSGALIRVWLLDAATSRLMAALPLDPGDEDPASGGRR
jgi:hypothetical protein